MPANMRWRDPAASRPSEPGARSLPRLRRRLPSASAAAASAASAAAAATRRLRHRRRLRRRHRPPPPPTVTAPGTGPSGGTLTTEAGTVLLATAAPQILNFAVVGQGMAMPAAQLEQAAPLVIAPAPRPLARAPVPVVHVPIVYAPKQDRN